MTNFKLHVMSVIILAIGYISNCQALSVDSEPNIFISKEDFKVAKELLGLPPLIVLPLFTLSNVE